MGGVGATVGAEQTDPPGMLGDQGHMNTELLEEAASGHRLGHAAWQAHDGVWSVAYRCQTERLQSASQHLSDAFVAQPALVEPFVEDQAQGLAQAIHKARR